jgi:hypothetical protein
MEGIKPGSSALQADAMTTSPRRQGYENKMLHSGESNDHRSDIKSPKILLASGSVSTYICMYKPQR